jgi:pimeloyl-ACP methyl ester carboxylesterase
MTQADGFDKVISADGTAIAYWRSGTGRPLVLVHGTTADHGRWGTVRALFEPYVELYAVDRRGRGASGDVEDYSLDREVEDVVAVVDAVAAEWGGPVDLLGHSYGGLCSLSAAQQTANVRRLVVYEAPVLATGVFPPGFAERIEALLDEDRREEVIVQFFREVLRVPDDQLSAMRALPAWSARVDAAPTILREERAVTAYRLDRSRLATSVVPTLLLAGSASLEFLRASTDALAELLPDVEVAVLEGQGHTAMDTAPQLFADTVLGFLRS